MPIRKIRDIDQCSRRFNPCCHPEHNPPSMMVYPPGEYEHECPACGHVTRFIVYPKYCTSTAYEGKYTWSLEPRFPRDNAASCIDATWMQK